MSETRCGFCAIIGAPNAGKSTLVNQLAGSKVSIVSHKVQTTRARLRAIFMEGDSQVIVVDTPGIFNPKRKLDEAMVENAWSGSAEADVRLSACLTTDSGIGVVRHAQAGYDSARRTAAERETDLVAGRPVVAVDEHSARGRVGTGRGWCGHRRLLLG